MTLNVVAVDADGDPISLTSSLPGFAVLNQPTSGTGIVATTIILNPLATDAGTHNASVTATAGAETDTEEFTITVGAAGSDLPPAVTAPSNQSVTEGDLLSFIVTAADPDQDAITSLTATPLPAGASFTPNGTYTSGTFNWTPTSDQSGQYDVVFTAMNALTGSASTHIMVLEGNAGPVTIAPIDDVSVAEGGSVTVNVSASDPDSSDMSLSASGLPAFATLNPPTTSTGTGSLQTTITVAPGAGTAGSYPVTLTVTAGSETDTEAFTITVTGTGGENTPPVVDAPDTRTVNEGELLTFTVTATDADSDTVGLSISNLPNGATFVDNGDNTGTFTWTPGDEQSGSYTITFTGDDGNGGTDTETTAITVNNVTGNTPPVVDAPDTRTVDEGELLTFTVTATDADSDTVGLSISNLPNGATFVDNGDNTGTFTWTPGDEQSGSYTVTFTGDDGNGGTDTETTRITVNDVPDVDFETNATIIGRYNRHKKFLCFRILQEDAEFDLRDVTTSSVTLDFEGRTLDPMAGKTHIGTDCDDCFECDDDGDHNGDDGEDCDREDCEAAHLRTCFSMDELRGFFDGDVLDGLKGAEIHGTLSTGETFVATLGGKLLAEPPGHDKNGDDDGDDNGDDRGKGDHGKKPVSLHVRPNPMNPKAEITFSLAQAGPVRIALYDLHGRLVKTILDESRSSGDHVVSWDTSEGGSRVPSGVYFLKIEARQGEDVRRVTVLK